MSKIFISHATENNAEALAVAQWLESQGWDDYFLDFSPERGINGGERWKEALRKSVHRCEAVIVLLSERWLQKEWCIGEYTAATILDKIIYGLVIEPLTTPIPPGMKAEWQICNLVTGSDYQSFRVEQDGVVKPQTVQFVRGGLTKLKQGLRKTSISASYFKWPPADDP